MIFSKNHRAFTLAELMTAMGASVLVIGALLLAAVSLQRNLIASENFATWQADQRRLIDYVTRELRRGIRVSATDEAGSPRPALAGDSIAIEQRASLVVMLPGYYRSQQPGTADYDATLEVVQTENGVAFGTSTGAAPGVQVSFRKMYIAAEGTVCFVRQEAEETQVIVRDAADLYLRVRISPDGHSCDLEAWFRSPFTGIRPVVSTNDRVLLRNLRVDLPS